MNVSIVCEVGEKVEIDGVVYVGVINTQKTMGMNGYTILENVKKNPDIKILKAKQKNGYCNLVPEKFIESLQISYICKA